MNVIELDRLYPIHVLCARGPVVARVRDGDARPHAWCTYCGDTWDDDDATLEALRLSEERYYAEVSR